MSSINTRLPQVSRVNNSESHTEQSVSLTDSGGGKYSTKINPSYFYIATYNIRTMRTQEHLDELEQELNNIKWDILGLCETRLPGEKCTTLKSGHTLFQKNSEENSHIGGVALLINKRFPCEITKYCAISNRVIYIIITLNRRYSLQIIHGYAPTGSSDNEEAETFYEDMIKARRQEKTQFVIITGDFNAKIGTKEDGDTHYIGHFGLGDRNERGEMLYSYLNNENLFCLNTFFEKPKQRKWTWISPDEKTKNEIDYILSNKNNICTDVTVLNKFYTGSDHRLVRAKIKINMRTERNKLIKQERYPTTETLTQKQIEYQNELETRLAPIETIEQMQIDELATRIKETINISVKKVCSQSKTSKTVKLQPSTVKLIRERRERTDRTTDSFKSLNREVKREIRKDSRNYTNKLIKDVIRENCRMKVLKAKNSRGRTKITKMKNEKNVIVQDRKEISKAIEEFYTKLYSPSIQQQRTERTILNIGSEEIPEITNSEIRMALSQLKNNKCAGEDRITAEMLKIGGRKIEQILKILFNKIVDEGKIPQDWYNSEVILIFKKGDNTNIENYRPISILSHLYKLLTKIITNRITNKLDFYQPVEQAGFRKHFSTTDHLHTIRTLIEKCTEYNVPLHVAFVDFQKAFDSVEIWAVLESLENARIDSRYTNIIKNIYENASIQIKLDEKTKTNPIKLQRGVRQGDTISPKLFTLVLEDIFKKLKWDTKGVNIDGVYLNHLRFADDIALIANNLQELNEMLQQLNDVSATVGLKMNYNKTKIMSHEQTNITIQNHSIENVEHYVYLGHDIRLGKSNQDAEIKRRTQLAWAAFGKLTYILKNNSIPINLKRKVYDTCILPVCTYGVETMSLTKKSAKKLETTQRAMERSMLGISLRDKIRNTEIRRKTKVRDIVKEVARMKWRWAGHIARCGDNRWTRRILEWRPRETTRSKGRPQKRWVDDIRAVAGKQWMRFAKDRERWKQLEETYIQEWMDNG